MRKLNCFLLVLIFLFFSSINTSASTQLVNTSLFKIEDKEESVSTDSLLFYKGKKIRVAIIDSGINEEFFPDNFIAPGYNFISKNYDTSDEYGHGTQVAKVIYEQLKFSGVYLDHGRVEIVPIKVLNSEGNGDGSSLTDAIKYAVALDCTVINVSLGIMNSSSDLEEVVAHAVSNGVLIVAASSNNNNQIGCFPAAFPEVISVGIDYTNPNDVEVKNSFGLFDIIVSSSKIPLVSAGPNQKVFTGTSAASAYTSGKAIALMLSEKEVTYADKVRKIHPHNIIGNFISDVQLLSVVENKAVDHHLSEVSQSLFPLHVTGESYDDDIYVHQWIALQGYKYFISQVEGSDLEEYMGYGTGDEEWLRNSFLDSDTIDIDSFNLLIGTREEDVADKRPFYQGIPFVNHFMTHYEDPLDICMTCNDVDGVGIEGLNASQQASIIWDDYAKDVYPSDKRSAYLYLGHVAHLLADMSVPAHVNHDYHGVTYYQEDSYEYSYLARSKSYKNYTYGNSQYGDWVRVIPVMSSLNSLFYETARYTADYDSDSKDGLFHKGGDEYVTPTNFQMTYTLNWHNPDKVTNEDDEENGEYVQFTGTERKILADDLMPYGIMRTADLFRLWYKEVDKTPPTNVVLDFPNGTSPSNPTVTDSLTSFPLSCQDAVDSQSGIVVQGYRFQSSFYDGYSWSDWEDITDNPSGTSVVFTPENEYGLYKFQVIAENGGGKTTASAARYLRIDPPTSECNFTISPSSKSFDANGGNQRVDITASDSYCSWNTSEALSWVNVSSLSGTGDGFVTVSAVSNSGAQRSGSVLIAGNIFSVSQEAAIPDEFSLTVELYGDGSGSVTSADSFINCGSQCSKTYPAGTVVDLTYHENSGADFRGWSGACSDRGTCTVTINGNVSVTASFGLDSDSFCSDWQYDSDTEGDEEEQFYIDNIEYGPYCANGYNWHISDIDSDGYDERYMLVGENYAVWSSGDARSATDSYMFSVLVDDQSEECYDGDCDERVERIKISKKYLSPSSSIEYPKVEWRAKSPFDGGYDWYGRYYNGGVLRHCWDENNNNDYCDSGDHIENYLVVNCGVDTDCNQGYYCSKPTLANPMTYYCAVKPQVAMPTFSPAGGGYSTEQIVSINTITEGASIRYTVDGSTPSSSSGNIYSAPINVNSSQIIKAVAYKDGMADSTVTSSSYLIDIPEQVEKPNISPVGGNYQNPQSINIQTGTTGAQIRYTIDGFTPTSSYGTVYTGPFTVEKTTMVKAIAYKSGMLDSEVATNTYDIRLKGDVDQNSFVDLEDLVLALKALTGSNTGALFPVYSDVNGDSRLGVEETIYILRDIAGLNSYNANILFSENFSDGDYTSNPSWAPLHASIAPGQIVVVDNSVRILRTGAGGSGQSERLELEVDIPINAHTTIAFDAKPVYRSVRSGCGDSCTEHPANVQLYLEDASGAEYIVRYSVNYDGAVQDVVNGSFKQYATSADQNTWATDLQYTISEAWPDVERITKIMLFGAGWDFESYIDNVVISQPENTVLYSESFSSEPGFTSLSPDHAYWDSAQALCVRIVCTSNIFTYNTWAK